ncbi:uncharacterized protein LOC122639428 isoform X2 [Telopea speciosissima]|uniref:uncharacterized protein LOC122639428 isoform X2 n=1 Tax=Telopea speciosissima TaxID=54955 RepID=UPI001CC495A4|nr:uncharacterized protein LOC122639428 isoform X2 [Telopea speciosissima]
MGGGRKGGRKSRTLSMSEVTKSGQPKANCSVSARNLRKEDLSAVIFGCKNYTINECLSQKLFGLPILHFSYVKNIVPGMPLFLFNYSDRRLHGIFEAASNGRQNINPHGWTANENEETEYPAQVRITIRMRCQALMENQFRPVIADNYYTDNHFWFELDRAQTSELISLFEASSASAHPPLPKKVCTSESISSLQASSASAHSAMQKKGFTWCDVVKTLANPDKRNRNDDSEPTCNPVKMNGYDDPWADVSEAYLENLDQSDLLSREVVDKEEEPLISSQIGEILTNSFDHLFMTDPEMQVVIADPMTSAMPSGEQSFQEEPLDSEENRVILVKSSCHRSDPDQSVTAGSSIVSEMPSVQKCFQEEPLVSADEKEISDSPPVIAQLMEEVQKLQASSCEQLKKTTALENNLSHRFKFNN